MQKISAQSSNTGFVSGNIWYSKDPFEEGDKIKIYTLIFNPDSKQLSGTVNFFDNTVLLGKKDFSVAANASSAISISWTATAGDHSIFGKIENAKFLLENGNYQTVSLVENQTEKSLRTVPKKIIPKPADTTINTTSTSVSDIAGKIPTFITGPIISAAGGLETFRNNLNTTTNDKKEAIQKEIKALDNSNLVVGLSKGNATIKTDTNPLLKPFKYVEIFFLSIFSFILNNKIIFYGILIVVVFFILRFIWKKIF